MDFEKTTTAESEDNDSDVTRYSFAPKLRKQKPRLIYNDQLICLISITVMAAWRAGMRAPMLIATSVLVSILVDMICCGLSKKVYNPRDISTITAGMGIALMMPASVSYLLIVCSAALAIGIKHIFGGKDNYIFNPSAVTLAFLIICYPASMLLYPKLGEILPIFGEVTTNLSSGIESYLMKLGTAQAMSWLDVFLGNFQGPMGTTHVLVILVCAVCLLFRRSVSALVTLSALFVIVAFAAIFPLHDNFLDTLGYELVGGYLLFGLLFLANDPQTMPKTELGRVYYGIVIGALSMLFRYFGKVEGSFVFALLVANPFALRLDETANKSMVFAAYIYDILRRRVSAFERVKETAKAGEVKKLSDTQEIIINPINYDMPPIDNKVIKINRKKRNILTITREKLAPNAEKDVEVVFKSKNRSSDEEETAQIDMKRHVRDQLRVPFRVFDNVVDKTKKRFTKFEVVEPVRHISQQKSEPEKPEEKKPDRDLFDSDIEISDFEELKEFQREKKNDEVKPNEE